MDCLTARARIRLKGITTKSRIIKVKISAEDRFPILRESLRCIGYRTKENIMAQRIGLRKGRSISNAKAIKKPVSDKRK
jgi:hypothetical protein